MYLSYRNMLGFAILGAAALASWYWSRDTSVLNVRGADGPAGPLGYYLRDAAIKVMDEDGSVLYEISAEAIEERPDQNETILSGVFVRYSSKTDVPWEVSADSGVIPSDERFIELSGEVELSSIPDDESERTIVRTPRLRFAPDDFLATTDTTVSLVLGEQRLDAVGMSADLQDDHLELKSSVHGQFER
jgi:LPS export ABC transporter protein LptC